MFWRYVRGRSNVPRFLSAKPTNSLAPAETLIGRDAARAMLMLEHQDMFADSPMAVVVLLTVDKGYD
jgi:hypothetical protein